MANPPIVIGPFDNVPAPGSPIRSNWPQEISTFVSPLAKRWGGNALGGTCPSGGSVQIGDLGPLPGGLFVVFHVVLCNSTAPLNINIKLFGVGSLGAQNNVYRSLATAGAETHSMQSFGLTTGGGTVTVNVENLGPQPVDTYADASNHALFAIQLQTP